MEDNKFIIPTKDTPKPHNDKNVLLEAMKYRYATKKFDPSKVISDEDFQTILESARLAPTSFGLEPWKILVIQNKDIRNEMMPHAWGAKAGLEGASHFVVFLTRNKEDITFGSPYMDHMLKEVHELPDESYQFYSKAYTAFATEHMHTLDSERTAHDWTARQAYIVMANMMVMAAYMGIDSCPLEGYEPEPMKKILADEWKLYDPAHYNIAVMAAFGYRAEVPHRDKSRRPLSESVEWVK